MKTTAYRLLVVFVATIGVSCAEKPPPAARPSGGRHRLEALDAPAMGRARGRKAQGDAIDIEAEYEGHEIGRSMLELTPERALAGVQRQLELEFVVCNVRDVQVKARTSLGRRKILHAPRARGQDGDPAHPRFLA